MGLFVLAGDPVAHSASPHMFAAAFAALGLDHTYEARRLDEAGLREAIAALRRGEVAGMNVTIPHKALALALADDRAADALACGAANVLFRVDGRVVAANTDAPALREELAAMTPDATGRALVLGSGGAARAAVLALHSLGVTRITLRSRSAEKAAALEPLASQRGFELVREPLVAGSDEDVTIVVQATSAGMTGASSGDVVAAAVAWERLPARAIAYDVIYTPPVTPFVAAARARGHHVRSGAGMLAAQGALAFEQWLGIPAPRAAMRAALDVWGLLPRGRAST